MKCRPALLGLFLLLLTIFANGCEEACEGCTGGHAGGAHFEFPVYSSPVINPDMSFGDSNNTKRATMAANFQWASGGGSAVQYLASSGAGDTNDWWVYVTFDTTYAGALPTITGPTTVYKDPATNKPYAWVYIPKGTSFMAFQAASSLGSYMWYYKPGGLTSKCSASTGLLSTAKYGTNDHCYQLNCPSSDFTYCEFRTSTTFYSPYSSSATNTILANADGVAVGANTYSKTLRGRQVGGAVTFETVVRIQQASGGSNGWWSTGYQYWYIYGAFDAVHSPSALYWYPFSGTYTINQGNGGTFSHGVGTSDEYAIDFGTPANTPIYAARAGYVSFVIYDQQYSKFDTSVCPGGATGCTTPGSEANMVVVTHPDDTQALYVHFVQNGATVSEGDSIAIGQQVGLAGNTGYSTGAHLHFVVRKAPANIGAGKAQPIQIKYTTDGSTGSIPAEGTTVTGTAGPKAAPVATPKAAPVAAPKAAPVAAPKAAPVAAPKAAPVAAPKAAPVAAPKAAPVAAPKAAPVAAPKAAPVAAPKAAPVAAPKAAPVAAPKAAPVAAPKAAPVATPKAAPTAAPKATPTAPAPKAAPSTPAPKSAPSSVPVESADAEADPIAPPPVVVMTKDTYLLSIILQTLYPLTQDQVNVLVNAMKEAAAAFINFGSDSIVATVVPTTYSAVEYLVTITFTTDEAAQAMYESLNDPAQRGLLQSSVALYGNQALGSTTSRINAALIQSESTSAAALTKSLSLAVGLVAILISFMTM